MNTPFPPVTGIEATELEVEEIILSSGQEFSPRAVMARHRDVKAAQAAVIVARARYRAERSPASLAALRAATLENARAQAAQDLAALRMDQDQEALGS